MKTLTSGIFRLGILYEWGEPAEMTTDGDPKRVRPARKGQRHVRASDDGF